MDFHVLIIIACVFIASLSSLLFINKYFRNKTFEEVAAEKRLLAEKLYGPSKGKRQQQIQRKLTKKENKKEKKQQQKAKDNPTGAGASSSNDVESQNDSDGQSETQSESSPSHHKKIHVEFVEPAVELITDDRQATTANGSGTDRKKEKHRKISGSSTGYVTKPILVNKSEPVIVKENMVAEPLNHFDIKPPKDVLELKRQSKESPKEDLPTVQQNEQKSPKENSGSVKGKDSKKSGGSKSSALSTSTKKEEKVAESTPAVQPVQEAVIIKEIKQHDEKVHKNIESPKSQQNKHHIQQQKNKRKIENSVFDHIIATGSDVISVNTLMSLFNKAELNRNEIQILIDYLLNKQQDTPANHSEWSDDIVQKLKKQLSEKEKALQDEQTASAGIQAKLRDLRMEINAERIHFNTTTKVYMEKLQSKETEVMNLNQEIQNLSEKLTIERQQFQAKLHHEKQASTQELLGQIQQLQDHNNRLQNEIVQLQMIANASHQTAEETKQKMNEIIQQQTNQIIALEQNLNDAKKEISNQKYDLELAKIVENEKETHKVEIRNLQNALDSTKAEINMKQNEINENHKNFEAINKQIDAYKIEIESINGKYVEQLKQNDQIRIQLAEFQELIRKKEHEIHEFEQSLKTFANKENELLRQINEQKEKNNELRTKNWKLIDALQKAEITKTSPPTILTTATDIGASKNINNLDSLIMANESGKVEKQVRELFHRLFPEAVNAAAASSLSLPFYQWIEQVVILHNKLANTINNHQVNNNSSRHNEEQQTTIITMTSSPAQACVETRTTSTNTAINEDQNSQKSNNINNSNNTNSDSSSSNNSKSTSSEISTATSNHIKEAPIVASESGNNKNNSNSNISCSRSSTSSNHYHHQDNEEAKQVLLENVQLRTKVEQLTSIVTKTENLLTNLETQARNQEAHWRNVVQSKQEEILLLKNLLKNSNGEAI